MARRHSRIRQLREPFVITLALGAAACDDGDDTIECNGKRQSAHISCNPPFYPPPWATAHVDAGKPHYPDAGADAGQDGAAERDGSPRDE